MNTHMKKRMTIMSIALVVVFGGIIAFNLFKGFMMKRFFAHYEPPAVTVSSVKAKKSLGILEFLPWEILLQSMASK